MSTMLALREVSLTFWRGRHAVGVLREVSLEVAVGELVAVLARPAQGKSTLLEVAAGARRPDDGRVVFDDVDLWQQSQRRRSRLLASDICHLSADRPGVDLVARELVALPLLRAHSRRTAYAQADHALRRVGLAQCAEQRWDSLADSERALLMLARGLARSPRLLLLDDLMVGLSLSSCEKVGRLLSDLTKEHEFAALMSATDAHTTVWCDRVGSLAAGRLQLALDDDAADPDGDIVIDFARGVRRTAR
jgi:predicted ABC-type transport system involved in lysophospholipase L1 biosynthesis ATPase subunit